MITLVVIVYAIMQAAADGNSSGLVLSLVGSAGVGAGLGAVVNALSSRKKLGAETTSLITQAATGVLDRLESENERIIRTNLLLTQRTEEALAVQASLQKDLNNAYKRMEALEASQRAEEISHRNTEAAWRQALEKHVTWDAMAVELLRKHDVELPPPPSPFPLQ